MPQVDLETLVSACAGGGSSMDRKIACETLADAGEKSPAKEDKDEEEEEVPPDFPPESFWLSRDAELDWFDRNAFFERKESQKGNNNSNPNSMNLNPNIVPGSSSSTSSTSQRYHLKSKAAIIGLPKGQKSYAAMEAGNKHRKNSTAKLFPTKRSSATAIGAEPSSPKVSCMGRVRSKKDRKRRSMKVSDPAGSKRTGLFASFRSIFRRDKPTRPTDISEEFSSAKARENHAPSVEIEPPGLGGLNRFVSGRRSSCFVDDVA